MNLIQESQQTFEKIAKECQERVITKKAICADVDANIRLLKVQRNEKGDRLSFYKNVIDSGRDKPMHAMSDRGEVSVNQNQLNKKSSAAGQAKKDEQALKSLAVSS